MSLIILISSLNLCLISEFNRVPKNLKKKENLAFYNFIQTLGNCGES